MQLKLISDADVLVFNASICLNPPQNMWSRDWRKATLVIKYKTNC